MGYTVERPAAVPRPGVVTAAALLMGVAAVVLLLTAGLTVLPVADVRAVLETFQADNPEAPGVVTGGLIEFLDIAAIEVLLAVAYIVLAFLVAKGKQPARVLTWALGSIAVLYLSFTTAYEALRSLVGGSATTDELTVAIAEVVPSWQVVAGLAGTVSAVVLQAVVIILLSVPAAHAFFRREQEIWVTPMSSPDDLIEGGIPPLVPPVPGGFAPPYDPASPDRTPYVPPPRL